MGEVLGAQGVIHDYLERSAVDQVEGDVGGIEPPKEAFGQVLSELTVQQKEVAAEVFQMVQVVQVGDEVFEYLEKNLEPSITDIQPTESNNVLISSQMKKL